MKALAPLALALLTTGLATGSLAAGTADAVTVADPYVRLAPPGAPTTAAYMVLKNAGAQDARLVKAENPVSKVTELHTHTNEGGVMKMRQVPAIDIKAKGETKLEPGGLHVMLIGLKAPMKEGDKVTLTLGFADGSSKQVEAPVVKAAAAMPAAMDHSAHGAHKH
jgi:copper(I)-binding protein